MRSSASKWITLINRYREIFGDKVNGFSCISSRIMRDSEPFLFLHFYSGFHLLHHRTNYCVYNKNSYQISLDEKKWIEPPGLRMSRTINRPAESEGCLTVLWSG